MYVLDEESLPLETVTVVFKLSELIIGITKSFFMNTDERNLVCYLFEHLIWLIYKTELHGMLKS